RIFLWKGADKDHEVEAIKKYLLNPIESREKDLDLFQEEEDVIVENQVILVENFRSLSKKELVALEKELGLAMTIEDILHIQDHFKKIDRDPSLTELKVLDTYWSDHCRHTTFLTKLENVSFEESFISTALENTYKL
ncbi:phosphoribosylformylglycinamidine synthase, partial [Streptococcus danieliae]|nr:phosphoribosylformylglycinamidine synthase [Streptococcus danieliae]